MPAADSGTVATTIRELLAPAAVPEYTGFAHWKSAFLALCTEKTSPWQQALLGGGRSGRVGYAFAAGYQAALHRLLDRLPEELSEGSPDNQDALQALCVTESGGNHPRAIQTTLTLSEGDDFLLNGSKTFITGGPQADMLLVAATTGEDAEGRPLLRLVKVPRSADGVTIQTMPPLPFVPEIDHAAVSFVQAKVTRKDILPGDGYSDYVKPFRTIEDIHVALALCGYLIRIALQTGYPQAQLPLWLSLAAQHIQLARLPAADPVTHLLLAATRKQLEQAIPALEAHWQQADPQGFALWERDKALLNVASKAREQRTTTALQQLLLP